MSYESVEPTGERDPITQQMRDMQAKRLRELRASTDPRSKLVQSAYVKAQSELRQASRSAR
jgi:hypothetical protein